jgi:hypothetical protein
MQTLFLPDAEPTKVRTGSRLDCVAEKSGPFRVRTVLAGRYKILEATGVESFKAHDLELDQTVTVREALPAFERGNNIWRQNARQLVSVRNPNFLNILDVISEKGREFVISEHPRGRSIAELLGEGSPFGREDVLALMAPLAGALDHAAILTCCPNQISVRWLFAETRRSFADNSQEVPLRELPAFFIRLDVWEVVRPRKNFVSPFLTWKAQKAGSKRLAVRYVALLTYELFGGETGEKAQVKRWFKPVHQLRDAGNFILYRGLRGSPAFRTGESFFHRLSSAIRSDAGKFIECHDRVLQTREYSLAYPGANDVLRKFNRETERLAIGLLGAVLFTALAFAVLLPEHYQKTPDLTREAVQAKSDALTNTKAATPLATVHLDAKSSGRLASLETSARVDQGLTESFSNQDPVQMDAGTKSTPPSVSALSPETNRASAQTRNRSKWSLVRRQDPAVNRGKMAREKYRSSGRPRFFGVKMKLIALWHRSLRQNEKPPDGETRPGSNGRKKAALTAAKEP